MTAAVGATPETTSRRLGPVPGSASLTRRERQQLFLEAYRNSRNVRAACQVAAVSRASLYRWKATVKGFAVLMAEAELDYCDLLRAQIDERSRSSDALLLARARAMLPEFKDVQRLEHALSEGGLPVRFTLNLGGPAPEAAAKGG